MSTNPPPVAIGPAAFAADAQRAQAQQTQYMLTLLVPWVGAPALVGGLIFGRAGALVGAGLGAYAAYGLANIWRK